MREVRDVQATPVSLFSDGPVPRLLDLAVSAQESGGEISLDDEIRRYIRLVRGDWVADWNCSVHAASGALEFAADSVERLGSLDGFPPEFREKAARAAGDMDPAEYLRTLAGLVRIMDREIVREYTELPMAGWEFLRVFPYLFGLDAILMDEGGPLADSVRERLENEHPYCQELAAGYATEAQRALVLFPGVDGLRARLSWATRDGLRVIIDTVNDHMQREHS
ncbi:hypothetical protein ACF05T_14075 [Streptomyces lateritius]|uniref:Transcriptional regulator n=1 Tax=Streptomyces lateritius TaxID=67313 RepID=A0ABW6YBK5_9ACTN